MESTAQSQPQPLVPALCALLDSVGSVSDKAGAPELARVARAASARAGDVSQAVGVGLDLWRTSAPHRAALARLLRSR